MFFLLQAAAYRDAWADFLAGALEKLPLVVAALVVFTLFYVGSALVRSVAEDNLIRVTKDERAAKAWGRIIMYMVILLGLVAALAVAGVNLGALMIAVGAVGFALAFAMQETLGNFISGLILLSTHPFARGDRVEVAGGTSGTVEEVGMRATRVRTFDGIRVEVPNRSILNNSIKIFNHHPTRRVEVAIGIGYEDDIPAARRILEEAVAGVENVLADPAPEVLVEEFGGSSVNLNLRFWTETHPSRGSWLRTRTEVARTAKEALEAEDIDIPFPIRTVFLHDGATPPTNGGGAEPEVRT